MIVVKKMAVVPYTPSQIFRLVSDIKNYSTYLPWCTESNILEQNNNVVIATIHIEYLKVKSSFTTKNINTPDTHIALSLVDGPFKVLNGNWNFTALGTNGCKVEFELHYKFSNIILDKLIGPVFSYISKNIVDCFIQEAHKQYGKQ